MVQVKYSSGVVVKNNANLKHQTGMQKCAKMRMTNRIMRIIIAARAFSIFCAYWDQITLIGIYVLLYARHVFKTYLSFFTSGLDYKCTRIVKRVGLMSFSSICTIARRC